MAKSRFHIGFHGSIAVYGLITLVLAYLALWPWLDRHIYVHNDYKRGKDFAM